MAQAQRLLTTRQNSHFRTLSDVSKAIGELKSPLDEATQSVTSRFFEVRGRLRLGESVVEERSVVQRNGLEVITLWRDRGASE